MKKSPNKTKAIQFRLTKERFAQLNRDFKKSPFKYRQDYIDSKLFVDDVPYLGEKTAKMPGGY